MNEIEQTIRMGLDIALMNGITLSVFKEITKPIADSIYKLDNEFYETCGIDEEDFWTWRFENYLLSLTRQNPEYPINKETLVEWANEEFKDIN